MTIFRHAKLPDIKQIQQIEKEYYEGFSCPDHILRHWIKCLPNHFIVAKANNKIVGFVFFEYFDEIKAVPFVHKLEHISSGKFVYVSEFGILDEFQNSTILKELFNKLVDISKREDCRTIIWLTGSKSKHDKIESKILLNNGFKKKENVAQWEAYPGHFVDDHSIWIKNI